MDEKDKPNGPELVESPKPKRKSGMPGDRRKTGFRGPDPSVGKATQFKPGQSGNPAGGPKVALLSKALRAKLAMLVPNDPQGRTYAQAFADKLAENALSGDVRALSEFADRTEGKPRQSIEVENTTLKNAFERMTAEEKRIYAERGDLPSWFYREKDPDETVN